MTIIPNPDEARDPVRALFADNPVVRAVVVALRVLGCVTRSNADSLLSLTVVQLTDRERAVVLDAFPLEVFPGAGGHMGTRPLEPGQVCACGRPAVRVDLTELAGDVATCGQHDGSQR